MRDVSPFVFIVGSPRSGTTVLGEILGRHSQVANWYEPYFIWNRYSGNRGDDVRRAEDITPAARRYIRREFEYYRTKSRARIVIDKSPEHCFQIPMVETVFPEARWIHIIRDGRDVTLSISREWEKRRAIVENRSFRRFLPVFMDMMRVQPFWRNRLQAIWFELLQNASLNPYTYLNKSKWGGKPGWGPRFPGWREKLNSMPLLAFNALQWRRSVECVLEELPSLVKESERMEVRYESLIEHSEQELSRICSFLGIDYDPSLALDGNLDPLNQGKWSTIFSADQKALIGPVLDDLLIRLDYAADGAWWRNPRV